MGSCVPVPRCRHKGAVRAQSVTHAQLTGVGGGGGGGGCTAHSGVAAENQAKSRRDNGIKCFTANKLEMRCVRGTLNLFQIPFTVCNSLSVINVAQYDVQMMFDTRKYFFFYTKKMNFHLLLYT